MEARQELAGYERNNFGRLEFPRSARVGQEKNTITESRADLAGRGEGTQSVHVALFSHVPRFPRRGPWSCRTFSASCYTI